VNDAGDAEKRSSFFELGHLAYFLGVATVVPLSVLVPVLVEPLSAQPQILSWPELSVVSYSMTLACAADIVRLLRTTSLIESQKAKNVKQTAIPKWTRIITRESDQDNPEYYEK